jgi:hypothetical protein
LAALHYLGKFTLSQAGIFSQLTHERRDGFVNAGMIGFGGHAVNIHRTPLEAICAYFS